MSDKKPENKRGEPKTGKYIYDKKLGKVVKVSDKITGLKKSGQNGNNNCPARKHGCDGCLGR